MFVILWNDNTSTCTDINKARKMIFSKKNNVLQIPPTNAVLEEHIKRAAYQGGHYVGQALLPAPELPTQTRKVSHQNEDGCTNYTGHGCLKQHTLAMNWRSTSVRRPAARDADA